MPTTATYHLLPTDATHTTTTFDLATCELIDRSREAGLVWWQDAQDPTRAMFDAAAFNALIGFGDKGIRGKFVDRLKSILRAEESDDDEEDEEEEEEEDATPQRKRRVRDCWEQDTFAHIAASGYTEAELVDARVRRKQLRVDEGQPHPLPGTDNYGSLCLLHVHVLSAWIDSKWEHASEFMHRLDHHDDMSEQQREQALVRLQRDLHLPQRSALQLVLETGRALVDCHTHTLDTAVRTALPPLTATAAATPSVTHTLTAKRRIRPTLLTASN
jgi:hypothetical protein